MRYVIASDLHGDKDYAEKIVKILEIEKAEKLVLLGDIYNHGPRNRLPGGYSPMDVASVLNRVKERLIVIKGNCDSQVDTMISEFSFIDSAVVISADKTVFLTHGHVFNKDNMPSTRFDAIVYGHFHTGFIERKDEMVVANAGSISLPKNGTPNSYIVLEDGCLTLKTLDGEIINSTNV